MITSLAFAVLFAPAGASAAVRTAPLAAATVAVRNCIPAVTALGGLSAPKASPLMVEAAAQVVFDKLLASAIKDLDACGRAFLPAVTDAEKLLAALAGQTLSAADQKTLQAAFDPYQAARVDLDAALDAITDRRVEAKIKPTLYKYFVVELERIDAQKAGKP